MLFIIMENRRSFLRNAIVACCGVVIVPTAAFGESRTVSNSQCGRLFESAHTLDLRTMNATNKHLVVKGKVYDKAGLLPQSGATIEVLNPSINSSLKNRRAQVTSNENGEYEFLLDMPIKERGKSARIEFHISNKTDAYASEVIITSCDAHILDTHWERNRQLGDKLFPVKESDDNHTRILLNLSV